jgi:hypothetical protein
MKTQPPVSPKHSPELWEGTGKLITRGDHLDLSQRFWVSLYGFVNNEKSRTGFSKSTGLSPRGK